MGLSTGEGELVRIEPIRSCEFCGIHLPVGQMERRWLGPGTGEAYVCADATACLARMRARGGTQY